MSNKPTCAVQGLIRRGAMCSQIIVGRKLCGYGGKCEHQRLPAGTALAMEAGTAPTMEELRQINAEPIHG